MGKNKSLPIPIKTAKEIAVEKNYDMIIIIGINQDDLSGHVTTYGKTKLQCKIAGHIGQEILSPEVFGEDGKVMKTDWQAVFNNGKEYKKFEETEKESETKNKTCRRCGDELVVGVKENANGIQVLVEECVNDNCTNY